MMARIRTIKPEFWSSEQVMNCSRDARLLFIGIWNFADDCGRCVNSARTLKAQVFPGDTDIDSVNVRGMVDELSRNGLVVEYEVEGKAYFYISGWNHQKINKPQASKHPPPPFPHHSGNGHGTLPDHSRIDLILSNPNGPYLSGSNALERAPLEGASSLKGTSEAVSEELRKLIKVKGAA